MKKIKLFTLALAALFAGNAMAQTTIFSWQTDGKAPTVNTALTATGGAVFAGTTDAAKTFGTESAAYATTVPDDMKSTGTKGLKFGGNALYFKVYLTAGSFLMGDTVFVCGYNGWKISSTAEQTGDVTSALATGTSKTDYQVGKVILTADADTLWFMRAAGTGTCISAIKVVRPAETQDPVLSVNVETIDLYATAKQNSVEKIVTFSGKKLTAGTYNLVLTEVDGLTINPATVTIGADGVLKETVTIAYTSEVDVEENTANLALTIGELTSNVTINYRARISQLQQLAVTESTTWDWTKAGVKEIQFDVKDNDTIVLANADGIANDAQFNSQALKGSGEYVVRDGKYYQGAYLSFIVENAGNIKVKFSNTGNRTSEADSRYLYVNGTKTAFGSWKSKDEGIVTTEAIAVPAGKVELTFMLTDETAGNQYARIYSIEYTKSPSTAIDNAVVAEKAQKMIINGQLVIVKDGVRYNAQGVQL